MPSAVSPPVACISLMLGRTPASYSLPDWYMPITIASGHIAAALLSAPEIAPIIPLEAAAVVAPATPICVPTVAAPSAMAPCRAARGMPSAPTDAAALAATSAVTPVSAAVVAAELAIVAPVIAMLPPIKLVKPLDKVVAMPLSILP